MDINIGDKFGDWTVLKKSDKKYYYTCKCKCGHVQDVYKSSLISGKSKGCMSCAKDKIRKTKRENFDKNVIGKKFGRLTPIKNLSKEKRSTYLCECDCGNEVKVSRNNLLRGKTKSCGCLKTENSKNLMNQIKDEGYKKLQEGYDKGTNIFSLNQKISKNNSTGVKGVSLYKKDKYRAYISIKHRQIHLGIFDSIDEAAEARREAEEKYFNPLIKKYNKNQD